MKNKIKNCFMALIACLVLICSALSFAKQQESTLIPSDLQLKIAPEMGETSIIAAIDQATQSVDVAMYLFTSKKIAAALVRAAARGIQVRVLLESAPYTFEQDNQWLSVYWRHTGVLCHALPFPTTAHHFLHEKLMIIDHHTAWVMTLNFARHSFSKKHIERNFALLDTNLADVRQLEIIFEKDWLAQPVLELTMKINNTIVLSPLNTEQQLASLIAKAQSSIKIYADGVDDYRFIGALAKAATQGITVKIIDGGQISDRDKHYLRQHHVQLQSLHTIASHAKVIVVDNQLAYLGSANFTYNSFKHNRELGLIVHDQQVIQQLSQQFEQDWSC